MVSKYRNSRGFTTIYVIVFLAIFIPIMFFFTVDLPHFMVMNRKAKGALDNASSTAIVQIDESKASQGIIQINEKDAKEIALEVIKETFILNDDLTVNENSLISNKPNVNIIVINDVKKVPSYTTPNGTFYFENPSVLIYAEIPVKGNFFNFEERTIKHTAIAQAKFKDRD